MLPSSSSTSGRHHAGASAGASSRSRARHTCVRPQAAASPDVKPSDDTAEARRRLARQFRRHKLEPQPARLAGATAAAAGLPARLRVQGLLPRPLPLGQQHDDLTRAQQQQQQQQWGEWQAGPPPPSAAAASAAARELLEWQFSLDPEDQVGSSSGSGSAVEEEGGSPAASSRSSSSSSYEALLSGFSASPAGDAGKELTRAIMRAQHWRQVQSLVREHAPECVNPQHLCAALTRLVHLQHSLTSSSSSSRRGQREPQPVAAAAGAADFVHYLQDSIRGHLAGLQYRQACNALWAASKLQHVAPPDGAWVGALYEQAGQLYAAELRQQHAQQGSLPEPQQQAQQLEQQVFAMRHAAQLAYALTSLRQELPEEQVRACTGWILANTRQILQQHIQHHQPLGEQRQRRPLKHQQQLVARDLATVAWSLATLGAEPSPSWLSAFAATLSCRGLVSAGNYRDLSQLLWALAGFSRHAGEGSAAANSIHAAASAVLGAAQETPLASCDGQALANVVWALATLGQRPQLPYLNRLLLHAEAAASRGFLSPQGVSMVLWGLAALGVVPQASCMAALQGAAQQQLRHMTPQGLSNVLWALAVLERPPSRDFLAAFWPACRALLPQMIWQGVVNCLWAAARLGLQPPQEWLGDVAALMLEGRGLAALSSQGVSNVIWAMSRISVACRPGRDLLNASLQRAVQMLEQQQQQQHAEAQQCQQQPPQQGEEQEDAQAPAALAALAFNIYELSGLMNAACYLQQRQAAAAAAASLPPGQAADSQASPGADQEQAALSGVLAHMTHLLQEVTLPLLPTAAPSELAILLWSQVAAPPSAGRAAPGSSSSSGSGSSSSVPASGAQQQRQQQPGAAGPQAAAAATAAPPIPKAWMDAWYAGTAQAFHAASSRDLAQWVHCLAVRGARPDREWLASWQVASFRQMGRANSQDLSNMLWALAYLGTPPEPAWLQRHLWEVNRRQLQKQLLPQHYANIGVALAKLGHRPERDWCQRYQEDVLALMPSFRPQELSNVLWALAQLSIKADEELLAAAVSNMGSRLPGFKVNEVAVGMWALSRLRGQPGLRLMGAALQHCFSQARQLTPTGLCMLLWSVGNLETPPPKAWVAKLLVATQVRMPGFSARELSMLVVSLARLEYRPPDAWLACFAEAAAARMANFEAQALANTLWALATLHYTPSEAWMVAYDQQLARHITAFTPAHVAMTMWALSRLGWLPAPALWQQLQERAELHSASYCLRSQRMMQRAVRVLDNEEDAAGDEE